MIRRSYKHHCNHAQKTIAGSREIIHMIHKAPTVGAQHMQLCLKEIAAQCTMHTVLSLCSLKCHRLRILKSLGGGKSHKSTDRNQNMSWMKTCIFKYFRMLANWFSALITLSSPCIVHLGTHLSPVNVPIFYYHCDITLI